MPEIPHKTFTTLYRSFALPLMKFIVKRMGGNQEETQEVFSRTIAAAWEGFHTFKYKSSFFTWLCRIALNKIADYYREQVHENSKIVAPTLEELANYDSRQLSPEEWYVLNELCNSCKAGIKLLPKDKQQLLYLRYWREQTVREIAKQFNVSERAIEGRIYRAKQMLRKVFELKYPEQSGLYLKRR